MFGHIKGHDNISGRNLSSRRSQVVGPKWWSNEAPILKIFFICSLLLSDINLFEHYVQRMKKNNNVWITLLLLQDLVLYSIVSLSV